MYIYIYTRLCVYVYVWDICIHQNIIYIYTCMGYVHGIYIYSLCMGYIHGIYIYIIYVCMYGNVMLCYIMLCNVK